MGFAAMALAVTAVGHVFEHAGTLRLMPPGLEDIFLGWPFAAMIFIIGAVLIPRD